ncbi:MAG: hypothetical protein QW478_07825 [Candidatus Micrarchaeaceae archaeon]
MKNRKWIQKGIKHKGSLKKWATEHDLLTQEGNINLVKAYAYAKRKNLKHRIKQINLAKTLRKLRR